jgi:hypothetical protein
MKRFLYLLGVFAITFALLMFWSRLFGRMFGSSDYNEYAAYSAADPNLTHLKTKRAYSVLANKDVYYAVRGVSKKDFMACLVCNYDRETGEMTWTTCVTKGPEAENPIDVWTYQSAEIIVYNQGVKLNVDHQAVKDYGHRLNGGTVASLDAPDLEAYIKNSLKNGNYRTEADIGESLAEDGYGQMLAIRITFEECDGIVWDGRIVQKDGAYYVEAYLFKEKLWVHELREGKKHYTPVYIPLPDEITVLIPS